MKNRKIKGMKGTMWDEVLNHVIKHTFYRALLAGIKKSRTFAVFFIVLDLRLTERLVARDG